MLKNSRRVWIYLLLILLIALLFRAYSLPSESLWLDESVSTRQAQFDLVTDIRFTITDSHFPLYQVLLNVWTDIFGISELAVRSLSVIFGLLTVIMVFFLSRQLFSETTALVATALSAVFPFLIIYSQEARLYSMFSFLALLSIYLMLRFDEYGEKKDLAYYFIATILLLYTHLFALLVPFVQNLYLLYKHKNLYFLKKYWLLSQAGLLVLLSPWILLMLIQFVYGERRIGWIPKMSFGLLGDSLYQIFSGYLIFVVFLGLVVAFFVRKGLNGFRDKQSALLWMLFFIPPAIIALVSIFVVPLFQPRYFIFMVPVIPMAAAWFVTELFRTRKSRFLVTLMLMLVLISGIIPYYSDTTKEDWRTLSAQINNNTNVDDIILVHPPYQQIPFSYYHNRQCFAAHNIYKCNEEHSIFSLDIRYPCCSDDTPLAYMNNSPLVRYADNTTWLVVDSHSQQREELIEYFLKNKNLTYSEEFKGVKVYRFD